MKLKLKRRIASVVAMGVVLTGCSPSPERLEDYPLQAEQVQTLEEKALTCAKAASNEGDPVKVEYKLFHTAVTVVTNPTLPDRDSDDPSLIFVSPNQGQHQGDITAQNLAQLVMEGQLVLSAWDNRGSGSKGTVYRSPLGVAERIASAPGQAVGQTIDGMCTKG